MKKGQGVLKEGTREARDLLKTDGPDDDQPPQQQKQQELEQEEQQLLFCDAQVAAAPGGEGGQYVYLLCVFLGQKPSPLGPISHHAQNADVFADIFSEAW